MSDRTNNSKSATVHFMAATLQLKTPLFPLGAICATPAALDLLDRNGVNASPYFARHQRGDYGTVCADDVEQNRLSIEQGMRILSAYEIGRDRIYILTEADHSVTTMLLSSEY
jgi:hypothetical protein